MITIHEEQEQEQGGDVINGHLRKNEQEEEEEEEETPLLLPYLNEDIVEKIIVKTPAEALFNRLRYVCKPWYNLINNHPDIPLNRLLTSKSPCLISQTVDRTSHRYLNSGISGQEVQEITEDPTYTTCFIKMGIEEFGQEEYDLSPPFRKLCIMACANGLILAISKSFIASSYEPILYVVNPLTNQRLKLDLRNQRPTLPFPCNRNKYYFTITMSGFIFLPSTGEYKVVILGGTKGESPPYNQKYYIHILTFDGGTGLARNSNVDNLNWRFVEAPSGELIYRPPVAINDTFYWIDDSRKKDYIISFDARAEKFYRTPHKFSRFSWPRKGDFIEMGGYLGFWHMTGRYGDVYSKMSVWILIKDSFRTVWTKQYSISMDMDFMRPLESAGKVVLSSGNGEVLIFKNYSEKTLWAYNMKSNQWWKLGNNLKDNDWIEFCSFHVNNTLDLKSLFTTEEEVEIDLRSLFATE